MRDSKYVKNIHTNICMAVPLDFYHPLAIEISEKEFLAYQLKALKLPIRK